jgi:hypothetical protein
MRARAWFPRVSGFLVVGAILLAALLVSAAASFADVAHKYPGTPMGPGGASGIVDSDTSPDDYYSLYLFRGQEVEVYCVATGIPAACTLDLYAPGPFGAQVAYNNSADAFAYIPAVSGVYTLDVGASDHGQPYTVTLGGTENLPVFTATALSGASRITIRKALKVSGKVSPATTPSTVTIVKKYLVGRKWKSAGSAKVALVAGSFSYKFKPTRKGKWRLVAKYGTCTLGTTTYTPSKSGVKTVTVR